jgi:hypothetical protein
MIENFVDECLADEGDEEECRDILLRRQGEIVRRLSVLYPRISVDILDAVWESGVDIFAEMLAAGEIGDEDD